MHANNAHACTHTHTHTPVLTFETIACEEDPQIGRNAVEATGTHNVQSCLSGFLIVHQLRLLQVLHQNTTHNVHSHRSHYMLYIMSREESMQVTLNHEGLLSII